MLATGVDLSPRGLLAAAPPIVDARISDVILRKSDPTWRFALAANPTNPGLLIELRAKDGTTGLGSAGEILHLGHGLAQMRAALDAVVPVLLGKETSPEPLADIDRIGGPARAILQMALLDLVARSRGVASARNPGRAPPRPSRADPDPVAEVAGEDGRGRQGAPGRGLSECEDQARQRAGRCRLQAGGRDPRGCAARNSA